MEISVRIADDDRSERDGVRMVIISLMYIWSKTVDSFESDENNLKHDPFPDGKPMKLAKNWLHVEMPLLFSTQDGQPHFECVATYPAHRLANQTAQNCSYQVAT